MAPQWGVPELNSAGVTSLTETAVEAGTVAVSCLLLWRAGRRVRRGFPGGRAIAGELLLVWGGVGVLSLLLLTAAGEMAVQSARAQARTDIEAWQPRLVPPAGAAPQAKPSLPPTQVAPPTRRRGWEPK